MSIVLPTIAPPSDSSVEQADVTRLLTDTREALDLALDSLLHMRGAIQQAASLICTTISRGGKILAAGNGGSAAEAQHFSAELVGRYKRDRRALAALCLNTDTSVLTAVGNDFGYETVFARQIEALANQADCVVLFSTSGQSPNILAAARAARDRQTSVIALTGDGCCPLSGLVDVCLFTGLAETCRVQEIHMVLTHLLCELIECRIS
jgi:D-sedoheptulose 7-phosphate isomerase